MDEFYLNNANLLVLKQLDYLAHAANHLSDDNLFQSLETFTDSNNFNNNDDCEVPQRSAARLNNREVMIYRERLAQQMSSARKQVVNTGPRHRRGYSTDDNSSLNELSTFSDDQQSVSSDSACSSPSNSPQLAMSKKNPIITSFTGVRLFEDYCNLDPLDEDDDDDVSFFEEIGEACLCRIDAVVLVSSIHDSSSNRPILYIKV